MCQFSDSSNCLLNPDILQSYTEDENEENKDDYYMGVDFGRTHDATGIIILKKSRKEGKIYLKEKIKLNNGEYAKQFNLIREVFLKYNPKCCFCDAGGLGGPIVEELNRQVSSLIKGVSFNQTNKSEMFEYLRKVVFDRKLYIKSDFMKDIKNEIMMIRQIITDAGKTIYQANRTLDSHADLISALILALHGERQTPTNLQYPTSSVLFSHFGGRISRL